LISRDGKEVESIRPPRDEFKKTEKTGESKVCAGSRSSSGRIGKEKKKQKEKNKIAARGLEKRGKREETQGS
jgi:hypothetical protein